MSPEATAVTTRIEILRQEIAADRVALARHEADAALLDDLWRQGPADRATLAWSAVALHAWYTGFEGILERVARALDRLVPEGNRSHAELLRQMQLEIAGVRPALVPSELALELDELRKFRHFFRHAYHVELDATHLAAHVRRLLRVAPVAGAALDRFEAFLRAALERLATA